MSIGAAMAGGNSSRGREQDDFYPTPVDVTAALLRRYRDNLAKSWIIWEPAAGDCAMSNEIEKTLGRKVLETDLNPRAPSVRRMDFVKVNICPVPVDRSMAVITNPPFNLAEEFIRKALSFPNTNFFAAVLKSTYWHAKSRRDLFEQTRPYAVHPLRWRPDFMGLGRPTMEVQWVVWLPDQAPSCTLYEPFDRA